MTAVLTLRVYTGAGATESASVSGIDLISADNATNSLANRQANPITVGTNSYEKYVALRIDTAPSNYVQNFKIWGDGATMTNTTLMWKGEVASASYAQPVNTTSTVATTNFTTCTAGSKCTWDTTQYDNTSQDQHTKFSVFQLQVAANAAPGNWTQETVYYSYDEA